MISVEYGRSGGVTHASKKRRSSGDAAFLSEPIIPEGHSLESATHHEEGPFPTQLISFGNPFTDWPRGVSLR